MNDIDELNESKEKEFYTGAELIAKERERQITEEKWTADRDDLHTADQLAWAAATYALPGRKNVIVGQRCNEKLKVNVIVPPDFFWPFGKDWYKPDKEDRIRELVKAGSLIAAEIDRLIRKDEAERLKSENPPETTCPHCEKVTPAHELEMNLGVCEECREKKLKDPGSSKY